MSEKRFDLPNFGVSFSIPEILGLDEPADGNAPRLRAAQYAAVARLAPYFAMLQAGLGVIVALILFQAIGYVAAGAWVVICAAAAFYRFTVDSSFKNAEKRAVTRAARARHMRSAVVVALAWIAPLAALTILGTPSGLLAAAAAVTVLSLGTAIMMSPVPIVPFIIAIATSIGGAAALAVAGELAAAALALGSGAIACFGVIPNARDFAVARMGETRLAETDEVVSLLLREFEENLADWLWQIDVQRRVRSVSPRFAYALGRQQEEAEGRSLFELIAGRNWEAGNLPPSLHDLADRIKKQENFSNLLVQVSIRGEHRWWELSGTPIRDKHGNFNGFRGVGSDVTEQRESSEKIAYLARFDTLTSLPNRMQLNEALGEALKYAGQWKTNCAFLMIDLDRFKAVNDSLGHQVGDKLLAQVSERLQSLMDDNCMCGRLGGDEFAIVIRDASNRKLVADLANNLISLLSKPYHVDNQTLHVGASVGSAIGPRDGQTVEELMRNADLALYRAKDNGRGGHFSYVPSLHASAEERRQLEVSLREALEREELSLQFQPVVNAQSEQVVSFEALTRWNSEEHGFVSPGKFIPIAEDTRLIVPIGKWVMRKACEEARNWPEHVMVNVNVSPEQLLDDDFAEYVVECLAATGLRPERLEIEVTESIFLRDASIARSALEQVMALGCNVALDDFGTGYSSLGYIRRLRFSTIKVDRTFVKGAAQDSAESLAIIRAVVAMAQSLDMTTTAEGAETPEEVKLIRELGCDKIQGYYFGRPMSAEEARRIFNQREERWRA